MYWFRQISNHAVHRRPALSHPDVIVPKGPIDTLRLEFHGFHSAARTLLERSSFRRHRHRGGFPRRQVLSGANPDAFATRRDPWSRGELRIEDGHPKRE